MLEFQQTIPNSFLGLSTSSTLKCRPAFCSIAALRIRLVLALHIQSCQISAGTRVLASSFPPTMCETQTHQSISSETYEPFSHKFSLPAGIMYSPCVPLAGIPHVASRRATPKGGVFQECPWKLPLSCCAGGSGCRT